MKSVRYSMDSGHMVGVFDGARLVGTARYHPMRQWWHGRSMPMAGVAGVKIAPEERGRGTGRAMLARLLTEIAAAGYPVSALYPTTASVYRGSGWEFAGYKYETTMPAQSLGRLAGSAGPDVVLRRATPDDSELIAEIKGQVHEQRREVGPNTREPWNLRGWLDHEDHFAYLADDGFLSYRWAAGTDEIEVRDLAAGSAATARAFWQLLAGHGTVAHTVRACLSPLDPVAWLTRDPVIQTRTRDAWMLRIIDVHAAIAGRGYPAGVSVSAELEMSDESLPANAGRWTLDISGGKGQLLAGRLRPVAAGSGRARVRRSVRRRPVANPADCRAGLRRQRHRRRRPGQRVRWSSVHDRLLLSPGPARFVAVGPSCARSDLSWRARPGASDRPLCPGRPAPPLRPDRTTLRA